jgi:hypothetical protein
MIGTQGLRAPDGRVLFTPAELACRASGGLRLAPGFGDLLVILRLAYGQPMRVTSCCRSAAHNKAVGGDPRSFHVFDDPAHPTGGTCAIDIAAADAAIAHDLVAAAMRLGWSVGVPRQGVRFIHLDRRDLAGLPPAVFGY